MESFSRRGGSRDRRPLLASALFVFLLVVGLGAWPSVRAEVCPSILIASSSEKFDLLAHLARSYSDKYPDNGLASCGPAVRVEQVASGDAEQQLSRDWPDSSTRPDVWAPAASTWLELLRHDAAGKPGAGLVPDKAQSIASSPLVVAMPDSMARALGWPRQQPTWRELLELAANPAGWGARNRPDLGPFRLGKTDPGKSTSGIHTLIAEYYAATGRSSNLQMPDLNAEATQGFLTGVEAGVSHYAPTAGDFLANISAVGGGDGSYISALPVEEEEVFNYNEGRYSADRLPPRDPLDAVYPVGGSPVADHPYAVLQGDWVSSGKRRVAEQFLSWLLDPSQQAEFGRSGFRDPDQRPGPQLDGEPGIVPDLPNGTLKAPENPAVLAAVVNSWQGFRKRARLMVVLDLASADEGAAVVRDLGRLSPQDEVGVWPAAAPSPSADIGLLDTSRDRVKSAVESAPLARRGSQKALYATIRHAYDELQLNPEPALISAVVVIAAGADDQSKEPSLTALERAVRTRPGAAQVRIYTVALPGSDAQALAGIELASGGYASPARDPETAIRTCLANF